MNEKRKGFLKKLREGVQANNNQKVETLETEITKQMETISSSELFRQNTGQVIETIEGVIKKVMELCTLNPTDL